MIRNPYKQACTDKKRRERPWEETAQKPATDAAVVVERASIESNESFDGGIDWDAAIRTLDVAAPGAFLPSKHRSTSEQLNKPSEGTQPTLHKRSLDSRPPGDPNHSLPHQAVPPIQGTVINTLDQKPAAVMRQVPSHHIMAARTITAQPPVSENARKNDSVALASLRPDTWKPTRHPSPSTNRGTQRINKFNDPRQETLPAVLQFDPESVRPVQDSYRTQLVKNAELSAPLLNGWNLYSHQKKAILRGILMRRMILALDMGLGKTLIACVWAKAFVRTMSDLKVIVICPVSLKKEWKRTAEETTGLTVSEEARCINNASEHNVWITSWAKVPTAADCSKYVVVADEAHSMQSMQAARTQGALELMLSKSCVGVLLLSGTPMKNGKPSNLFPLLRAVQHPFGNNQRAYETHFCEGREVNFGRNGCRWTATGSSNLVQLRELSQSHLLHLTKEECLKELPTQTRVFQKVPVSSRRQLQHNQALHDLSKVHANSKTMENGNDAVLGAVQKVRVVGSLAKIDATVEIAKKVLQDEPAVVIFTSFCQVAKSVHQKLSEGGWDGQLLTGETPPKKRQGMVDKFQSGLSPVFVCTFGAGGVGLTLTAAHTVILVDRPWTPGEAFQAEDRVRRIGQTKPVKCIWMSAFELDQQIDSLLEQKSQTANAVLSSSSGNLDSYSSAPKLSIFQMLQKILPLNVAGLRQTSMPQFSQGIR